VAVRPPISQLDAHLGYWLRYVSNHVSHAFALRLERSGVTVAEWVLLRELYDVDALPPSRIADRLGMTRGAVTKLADRLIVKALVAREADAQDRRAQTLALTKKGEKLVPDLALLADKNDAEFFGHLKHEERAGLEQLLRALVERCGVQKIPVS